MGHDVGLSQVSLLRRAVFSSISAGEAGVGALLALLGHLAPEEDWGWGPEHVKLRVLAHGVALELTAGLTRTALSCRESPCPLTFLARPHFPSETQRTLLL